MSLPKLTIIPAGAGSGKTYTIQTRLADWIASGEVKSDRILAVTFTEAAAAELKERIRFELVRRERIGDALKLEQSYISTIHGFGLRVLKEFALDKGISPAPRLLDEDEQKLLIRKGLSTTEKIDPITRNLKKYGYNYDPANDESPEAVFRGALLGLLDRLRVLGRRGREPDISGLAQEKLAAGYGRTREAAKLESTLKNAAEALLAGFPESLESLFPGNATATENFRKDYRNIQKAAGGDALKDDWDVWKELQELRRTKKGAKTPDGYDDLAEAVMNAAVSLHEHPGPLADAKKHVGAMIGAAQDIIDHYARGKLDDSLLDYADMVNEACALLDDCPEVLGHLKNRIDCLVIDEFQDTNPMQFALLWKLHLAGIPALVVGDLKQAIMGFQNADHRLFEALQKKHPRECSPLTNNWRSSAPMMAWVNRVAKMLFGDGYVELEARAEFTSRMKPLEIIEAPDHIRSKWDRASWTAVRIRQLLDDPGQMIWVKKDEKFRRLRGGDIALLCPTHAMVATYAGVLQALGLRTRVERGGWSQSRIVQLASHALAWVVDPTDRHAALFLSATELGSNSLADALGALFKRGKIEDPLLEKLASLRDECSTLTPEAVLGKVIDALDLYGVVSAWPDAAQSRVNLLRFQAEAAAFHDANRQILIAGGHYGAGVKTFLSWLSAKAESNDGQPDPGMLDEDAVTVTTWHTAKGLEWPVVAVCGMHREVKPKFPQVSIDWESLDDFSDLMSGARLSIIPSFPADETNERFRPPLQDACEDEARRLLYVVLTRAREKVILEWPSHLGKSGKTTRWSLLRSGGKMDLEKNGLRVGPDFFPCDIFKAGKAEAEEVARGRTNVVPELLPIVGRRAIQCRSMTSELTPEAISPSRQASGIEMKVDRMIEHEKYSEPLDVAIGGDAASRGLILHKCFELLGETDKKGETLLTVLGTSLDKGQLDAIAAAAAKFYGWLEHRFSPVMMQQEVPVLGLDKRGSIVSGVMDLLIETREGYWIVDHKSDKLDDIEYGLSLHLPQLLLYTDIIRSAFPGKTVAGVAINWISRGEIFLKRL